MKWITALVIIFAVGGCSDRLATYPVSGKVVFKDGGTAHVGMVEFRSREHAIQARGEIAADGTFTLTTYETGDGAVAGNHDCVVVQLVMTESAAGFRPSYLGVIDPKFGNYATSGLEFNVSPENANDFVVTVESMMPPIKTGKPSAHEHGNSVHVMEKLEEP